MQNGAAVGMYVRKMCVRACACYKDVRACPAGIYTALAQNVTRVAQRICDK